MPKLGVEVKFRIVLHDEALLRRAAEAHRWEMSGNPDDMDAPSIVADLLTTSVSPLDAGFEIFTYVGRFSEWWEEPNG